MTELAEDVAADAGPAPAPKQVAILGAGPIGLAAALAAAEAGWRFTVYEAAPTVGGNVARWGHVRLFTPWSMNVSASMAEALRAAGRPVPDGADHYPTGNQLISDLLVPLANLPQLSGQIELGTEVVMVGRAGLFKHEEIATDARAARPFRILARRPDGSTVTTSADLVLDCTGNYTSPNCSGDGGIPAPGEQELGDRIVRTLPDFDWDRDEWAGRTILLIGAGKSAQTAARDLAELAIVARGTRIVWAVRSPQPDWGEVEDDPLPQRQALVEASRQMASGAVTEVEVVTGVTVDAFGEQDGQIRVRLVGAEDRELLVDRVLSLTGFMPDNTLHRQLQIHECYATAAPITLSAQLLGDAAGDCLAQTSYGVDVLRNPEPNYFIIGAKSYGRNSQFLVRIGYDQVAEVVGAYQRAASYSAAV